MTPTLNLNGSDATDLIEQRMAAIRALMLAEGALEAMSPNGRDYPDGNFSAAVDEHVRRLQEVRSTRRAIEGEVMDLRDAVEEREARKAALRG